MAEQPSSHRRIPKFAASFPERGGHRYHHDLVTKIEYYLGPARVEVFRSIILADANPVASTGRSRLTVTPRGHIHRAFWHVTPGRST